MVIQYLSDLHLEFPQNNRYFKKNPIKKNGDILILAGDITNLKDKSNPFFDSLSEFDKVFWIPGNHEYYGNTLDINPIYEEIRNNIILLNNRTVTIEGIKFIFSTLWSKIDPLFYPAIQEGYGDFAAIKGLDMSTYTHAHLSSMSFIKESLGGDNRNTVVVTHHVPTFNKYPKEHRNSFYKSVFHTDLNDLIKEANPYAWIYGHHHVNTPEFNINNTKLLTNQFGYYDSKCLNFDAQKNFKI